MKSRPICQNKFISWSSGPYDTIKRIFGADSVWVTTFVGPRQISMVTGDPEEESYIEAERAETIQKRIVVLRDVLDHIDLELSATNSESGYFLE